MTLVTIHCNKGVLFTIIMVHEAYVPQTFVSMSGFFCQRDQTCSNLHEGFLDECFATCLHHNENGKKRHFNRFLVPVVLTFGTKIFHDWETTFSCPMDLLLVRFLALSLIKCSQQYFFLFPHHTRSVHRELFRSC
jgi:hypothetical protein